MAEGAVKRINELLAVKGQQFELVDSTRYPVSGGEIDPTNVEDELAQLAKTAEAAGFSPEDARYLADLYGSNLPIVLTYKTTFAGWTKRKHGIELCLARRTGSDPCGLFIATNQSCSLYARYVGSDQSWCDRCNGGLF